MSKKTVLKQVIPLCAVTPGCWRSACHEPEKRGKLISCVKGLCNRHGIVCWHDKKTKHWPVHDNHSPFPQDIDFMFVLITVQSHPNDSWSSSCGCKTAALPLDTRAVLYQPISCNGEVGRRKGGGDNPQEYKEMTVVLNYPDECVEICNQLEDFRSSDSLLSFPGCRGSAGGFDAMTWHPGL
ncbi:hypothetical protein Y1Q_0000764 [Alligator mississippiensis]|uniref:Uncharacterized protein n=1 Tax=Alligator mississippiensis TaxID=8496 RepID=A0A151MCD9_ALLMI|nr:hypothetical protein Y1Q_0000764 [Alligator mississippiensis]